MSKVSVSARLHALMWGVFSLGGFIAAFLLPVLIYVNNIAYPLGLWPMTSKDPTKLLVDDQILGSLFVFVTIAGSLFHGVFRFQTTLPELGLKSQTDRIVAIGYAIIAVGIFALLYYLLVLNPTFVNMLPHP
jgi:succinate dehydrogenase subunit D